MGPHLDAAALLRIVGSKSASGSSPATVWRAIKTRSRRAKQLEEKASKARDWLTLHRLSRLLEPSIAPTPLALLGPLDAGPLAASSASAAVPAVSQSRGPKLRRQILGKRKLPRGRRVLRSAPPPPEKTPLEDRFNALVERLNTLQEEAGRKALLADVLAVAAVDVTHPIDVARFLHFFQYVLGEDPLETRQAVWTWAKTAAGPHPQVPVVLNLLAALADVLRRDPALADTILVENVEQWFRASLDLDPFHALSHFRAGVYYLGRENLGEAERCLARGFRLTNFGPLAVRLAEVYNRTERPRDALMVLDTCLREGCEDPGVAWEASLSALNLNQHEPLLTYLDRFEQLQPGGQWVNYYRALGLLELGRPREALAAVDEEARRAPDTELVHHILRACCTHLLEQPQEARGHFALALTVPLAKVDYLTHSGLCNLFGRLWKTVGASLPAEDSLAAALEQHLLPDPGLAPDELFEPHRQRAEECEDVHFYRCRLRQPLDETWPASPGCLAGQETWPHYLALWGVLARDEDEAWDLVKTWQSRGHSVPPVLLEFEPGDETYKDRPGVVWQGQRWVEEDTNG